VCVCPTHSKRAFQNADQEHRTSAPNANCNRKFFSLWNVTSAFPRGSSKRIVRANCSRSRTAKRHHLQPCFSRQKASLISPRKSTPKMLHSDKRAKSLTITQ